jgi:hypothetical protein
MDLLSPPVVGEEREVGVTSEKGCFSDVRTGDELAGVRALLDVDCITVD